MISNNLFLYTSRPSNGARELAKALHVRRIRLAGTQYVPFASHTVINWGSGDTSKTFGAARVLNKPELVKRSSNKLSFFQLVNGKATVPPWTDSGDVAKSWLDTAGSVVVARQTLTGHSGAGIVVIESPLDFVPAPLYTKYVKKEAEYRVHCIRDSHFGGTSSVRCFDIQRKIKDPAFVGTPNWRVRNHQNGFIYIRDNIQVPEDVTGQALQAFEASGLDFGAADVIWNGHEQKAFVLEINTAPGLVGKTVESYKIALTSSSLSRVTDGKAT